MTGRSRALALVAAGAVMVVALAGCGRTIGPPQATPTPTTATTLGPTATVATTGATPTPTGTPTPATTPLGPLSGTWAGTWTNTTPIAATGTFTLAWAQQGTKVYGALSVTGSNCLRAGNVTGNIIGDKLSFGAVDGTTTIDYNGTIVDNNTLSGTYHSDCGNSTGTWTATRSA
jgi:hypothetical protein